MDLSEFGVELVRLKVFGESRLMILLESVILNRIMTQKLLIVEFLMFLTNYDS